MKPCGCSGKCDCDCNKPSPMGRPTDVDDGSCNPCNPDDEEEDDDD